MTLVSRVLPDMPYATLRDYLDAGGGQGVEAARRLDPDVIIAEVGAKASSPPDLERLRTAVDEMCAAGMAGDLTVDVIGGPDEYLFGEETGLLEVVDGRAPLPRIAPPYRRGGGAGGGRHD